MPVKTILKPVNEMLEKHNIMRQSAQSCGPF